VYTGPMTDTAAGIHRHNAGRRLHITLTERQYNALREEAERTSLSMAEVVRRCIDGVLRPHRRVRFAGLELNVVLARRVDAAVAARRVKVGSSRGGQLGASRVRLRDD
jgi:hypothetical protein